MVRTGRHPYDSPISGRLPWHARPMGRVPPLPSSRAPRSRRSPASFEAHPGPDPLVLVVVLGVPCRLTYVRAADPKYVSLPQFGSYRLGHLPPHPHVRSAARRHRQARRHRASAIPEVAMGRPGPRYGEPLFGRTYDLLPACLARRAGRSEHTRKSRERGLGALNDCVTGELGIEPTPLTFAMCRYDPPARLVSAHAGGWPRERDRELVDHDGESPSAPRR